MIPNSWHTYDQYGYALLPLMSVAVVHVDNPRAAFVAIVLIQGNPFQEPTAVTAAPIERVILDITPH